MNKRRLVVTAVSILIVIISLLTIVTASAETYYEDGDWKYSAADTERTSYLVAGYLGNNESIKIPPLFLSMPVSGIRQTCFLNNTVVKAVEIPQTVGSIGDSAFYGCSALKQIVIPSSVTRIGKHAFYDCSSLVYAEVKSTADIPVYCFSNCSKLATVMLSEGTKEIGRNAFLSCSNLTYIFIPTSVTAIHDEAFDNCENVVIYGYDNTSAADYAKNHSIKFVSLGVSPYQPTSTATVPSTTGTIPTASVTDAPESTAVSSVTLPTGSSSTPPIITDPSQPTVSSSVTDPSESVTSTTVMPNPTGSALPTKKYKIGDVDLDSRVTVKDATLVQKSAAFMVTLDRTQMVLANTDSTDAINVKDATAIQKYCAGFLNILFVGTEILI